MKLSEIKINEALTAQWTEDRIADLSPAKLKALTLNAKKAKDDKVLAMIELVVAEKQKTQKAIAAQRKKEWKEYNKMFDDKPKKLTDADLQKVARKIEEVAGNVFPDCDPIDTLGPWIEKTFHVKYDMGPILDAAAKKHLNSKSYFDYLADMWEDFIDDVAPERRANGNPWRTR